MSKTIPSRIKPVGLGRAAVSFLIDLGLSVGLFVLLFYTLCQKAILPATGYQALFDKETAYVMDTGLVNQNEQQTGFTYKIYEDTDTTTADEYAYKKYTDVVWHYFMTVVVNKADVCANVAVTSSLGGPLMGYTGEAKADSQDYGRWVYVNYFGYSESSEIKYFVPSVDNDFTSKPKAFDEAQYHKAMGLIMFNKATTSITGHYVDAVQHMLGQEAIRTYSAALSQKNYVSTLPAFIAPPIIFFFILPLCLKNGRTLGKQLLGTEVVTEDGFKAPKGRIILRQAVITMLFMVLSLPWTNFGMPITLLLLGVGFGSRAMSKTNQPLHDHIARTIVVTRKDSVIFGDEQDEAAYRAEHPEEEEEAPENPAISTYELERLQREESILDLSTINRRREEARNMTSFDEFEKKSDEEFAARSAENKIEETDDSEEVVDPEAEKAALADLAALEGLSPEEAEKLSKEPEEEEDPDGFVDERP